MLPITPLQLFKYLSDETRLTIMLLLKHSGELCVCDITAVLDESQPKISRHLAMLRNSGLLADRREGKWVYYRLSPQIPVWIANILEQAHQCQLDDIRQLSKKIHTSSAPFTVRSLCS